MKKLIYLFVILAALASEASVALEFHPISDNLVKSLRSSFDQAKTPTSDFIKSNSKWTCKLYGMRSRMQTANKKNFYKFSMSQGTSALVANSGAQIVRSYRPSSMGLVGVNGPIKDLVRARENGTLIAELSVPIRSLDNTTKEVRSLGNSGRAVVAYSVCKSNS